MTYAGLTARLRELAEAEREGAIMIMDRCCNCERKDEHRLSPYCHICNGVPKGSGNESMFRAATEPKGDATT